MKILDDAFIAALLVTFGATAQAQTEANQVVLGWSLNSPPGSLNPSSLVPPMVSQADPISISGLTRVSPAVTLLALTGLPAAEDPTKYISYRFTTGDVPSADIVLNHAGYSLNNTSYGQHFQVQAVLHDAASNINYPLGDTVNFNQVRSVVNVGTANQWSSYFFVNNQTWPLQVSELKAEQGNLPALKNPVVLAPNHVYELRFYLSQQGTADGRGMIDDVSVLMKTVSVQAFSDGVFSLPAQSGGTTPDTVQNNDRINELPLEPDTYSLSVVDADSGLTLNSDGTITAAAGQPGTKTLTYQLCPKYDTALVAGFQSNACKTAVATVELTGPAFPPSVSINCSPNTLTDSENQQATCTITADTVVSNDLNINLTPLVSTERFTGSCTNLSSITIAAGQDSASCVITAVSNTTPGDGNVTAVMMIADPESSLYTVKIRSDSVEIQNDDGIAAVEAKAVPSLGEWVTIALTVLMGMMGVFQVRSRKSILRRGR